MKNNQPRPVYIDRIVPYINKDLIKVLVGQRGVGKSYLMAQLMDVVRQEDKKANIIYVNKEHYEFDHLKDYTDLMGHIEQETKPKVKNYLFIDEIQDISQFERALKSLQSKGLYDIYITGSSAFLLSGELATYLSGRYVEFKIFGLTYNEFLGFNNLTDTSGDFQNYLKYGGLPFLINIEFDDRLIFDYLKNVYQAILFKDVVARYNIRNVHLLENLVRYGADNVGSLLSAKKISDFLISQNIKVTPNLILDYLDYLERAFFLLKVFREDIKGKKIFEIGQKYYFEDLGLRHSVMGYRTADIGKILENIVYLHLIVAGYEVRTGKLENKEVDFVCSRGDQKIYVQVACLLAEDKTIEREFGNLEMIGDNYPKYVVSMDEHAVGNRKGILHVNVREFIRNLV